MYALAFSIGCCIGIVSILIILLVKSEKPKIYDKREIIENCTVEILTDSKTGECSVGWWIGTAEDEPKVKL